MQQIIMGVIGILIGLVALLVVAGWIVPLILSIVGRRRNWPSAGVWKVLAITWGCLAVLLALAIGGAIFAASRVSRSLEGDSDAALFNATTYAGKTGCLRLAFAGEVECVLQDAAGKSFRCASSNGSLTVPAGDLTLRACKATASDAEGKPWTASFSYGNEMKISVGTDAVQNAEFGPPFLVAVQAQSAPVSSKIRLDPVCADRAGNIYKITGGSTATAPTFQFLDARQQVVWSDKFEAG